MPLVDSSDAQSSKAKFTPGLILLTGSLVLSTLAQGQTNDVVANGSVGAGDDLLRRHCTTCHSSTRWESTGHTILGWHLVVARMRWLNGAWIGDDHQAIVDQLARRFPASREDALYEWVSGLSAMTFTAAMILATLHQRKRRRFP